MPQINTFARDWGDRGLVVLGINLWQSQSIVQTYQNQYPEILMLKDSGIRQKFNVIIIAIKQPDGTMQFNPSFEAVINAGDTVIAMGKSENMVQLEELLNPLRLETVSGI